jgi:glycosyltransferase involved in cell wall biosynthesis
MDFLDLFTVVIPHKNNSETLKASILSCIKQRLRPARIVVVDDGSSSDHLANAQYVIKDLRRHVQLDFLLSPYKGIGPALNFGISQIDTPYFARMDSDDISLPWRFSYQLRLLKKNNLDFVGSAAIAVNSLLIPLKILVMPTSQSSIKKRLLTRNAFIHPTVFGRTAIFKDFPYPVSPSEQGAEDLLLWRTMTLHSIKMRNTPLPCLLYRLHSKQYSRIRRSSNLKYLTDSHDS